MIFVWNNQVISKGEESTTLPSICVVPKFSYHKRPWKQHQHLQGCRSSLACYVGRWTPRGSPWGWISSSCQTWRSRCCRRGPGPSEEQPGSQTLKDPKSWWTRVLGLASLHQTPSSSHLQPIRGRETCHAGCRFSIGLFLVHLRFSLWNKCCKYQKSPSGKPQCVTGTMSRNHHR